MGVVRLNEKTSLSIGGEILLIHLEDKHKTLKVKVENFYSSGDGSTSIGIMLLAIINDETRAELEMTRVDKEKYTKLATRAVYEAGWDGLLDSMDNVMRGAIRNV